MSARTAGYLLATAVLIGGLGSAAPASAHTPGQSTAAGITTISAGRVGAMVAALTGLASVGIGALVLARCTGRINTGNRRLAAIVTLATGPTGRQRNRAIMVVTAALCALALAGLVAGASDGSLGTGNGFGGALFAMVLALIGLTLGGLTLARTRRTG